MRHFESSTWFQFALLAALTSGAVACSSDTDHGPPVGAPNVPIVVVDGGGTGGTGPTGQGAANNGGNPSDPGFAGSFNTVGGSSGGGFSDPSAGTGNFGGPVTAGSPSTPPFGVSGSPSSFGGSGF